MALDSARQLLDELMGRTRDMDPSDQDKSSSWDDPRICRHYLAKFCPHQLFTNTKADIGPCYKIHDDYVKRSFADHASDRERSLVEEEFLQFCQQTLCDVEKRIKRARQRLAGHQMGREEDSVAFLSLDEEVQDKVNAMSKQIEQLLEAIEMLGSDGKVEEAQEAMKRVDRLKSERLVLKKARQPGHWIQQRAEVGVAQEKQMEVCDVCGAFLIVNDVQQRVDDHLMGKQHVGFGKLKSAVDEILRRRKEETGGRGEENRKSDRREPESPHRSSGSSGSQQSRRRRDRSPQRDTRRARGRSDEKKDRSRSSERRRR